MKYEEEGRTVSLMEILLPTPLFLKQVAVKTAISAKSAAAVVVVLAPAASIDCCPGCVHWGDALALDDHRLLLVVPTEPPSVQQKRRWSL